MIDLDLASQFIQARGTILDKERLRCLLTGDTGDLGIFPISQIQNQDNGFALHFQPGNPSCINNTGVARSVLQDLNRLTGELERRMAQFILSCQNKDGIFTDPPETLLQNIPVWMEIGTFRFAAYYTMFSCLELLAMDLSILSELRSTVESIFHWQKKDGAFPGYLHNSWFGTGLLLRVLGTDTQKTKKSLAYLDQIPFDDWECSQLLWATETLYDAGLDLENSLIAKWVGWLISMQNKNGSFTSEDGERFNVDVTLNALRLFKKLSKF